MLAFLHSPAAIGFSKYHHHIQQAESEGRKKASYLLTMSQICVPEHRTNFKPSALLF